MTLHISSIRFKRSVNTPLEAGIMVSRNDQAVVVVDMLGKPVDPVWYFVFDEQLDIAYTPGPFTERTTSASPSRKGTN
jgi:hypothetical protein